SVGLLVGPGVGGVIVGSSLHRAFFPLFAACSLALVVWALALERGLPAGVNRPPLAAAAERG
ncbi:MAG: MFS transporter, partial [Candidatus Dormibacterales bacterium]